MNILTGNLDTDRLILEKLDNNDLLKVCKLTNKYIQKLCNEDFFRKRVSSFPRLHKAENLTWRKYYIYLMYWMEKLKEDFDFPVTEEIRDDPKLYYSSLNIVKPIFAYENVLKALFLNNYMYQLIKHNYLDLIEYFIEKGAEMEKALTEASRIKNKEAFSFIVSLGSKNFEEALSHAKDEEMKEYISLFL